MSLTRVQSKSSSAATDELGRVHVVTFGCQMNKYDSLLAEGRFRAHGYATTDAWQDADVILFNTCSVREHAEERVWSWLGELKRAKEARPELVIGVMGCMAQRIEAEVFRRAGHVDLVCGTRQFQHLPALVDEVRTRRRTSSDPRATRVLATGDGEVSVEREGEPYAGGLHGYLAVMRGCDLSCAFCIVPRVRGPVQSRPIDELAREARWMVEQGARAITLLGQTVNSYGEDFGAPRGGERFRGRQGRPSLADLIYRLQEIDGLARIRLVTLHAAYATRALAEALRDCDKCERFLPLPLQHGSDRVLRAMRRGYSRASYAERVDVLREHVPDLELGSDWIVGFPGETEDDYALCESALESHAFAVNYIFKYDPRPGTRAYEELADEVPAEVKRERNSRLLAAAEAVQAARLRRHIGSEAVVFVESESSRHPGSLQGRTRHSLPITFRGPREAIGSRVQVAVEEASAFGLAGTLVAPAS